MVDLVSVGLGGAVWSVEFGSRGAARRAAQHLMRCHPHHFAVVGDGRKLMLSRMAVDCLRERFGPDRPMTVFPIDGE